MRLLLAGAAAAALVALALSAALCALQERLIFQPVKLSATHRFDFGADVHERWIDVPGARLDALHLQLAAPRGMVFYLHGNAGNLADWFTSTELYRRHGFDLFMLDYRGYGKSSGRIESEAQLHADTRAAWDAIAARYVGGKRVILGRSLGTALAARLAAEVQPDLLLLVSSYTGMGAMAALHYPWVPRALLRYPLRTDAALAAVRSPVVLVHGERDEFIPAAHSAELHRLAPGSRLLIVPGAGHNDLENFPAYFDAVSAALEGA